ncbi:small ribosomal subunit protein mS29 [Monosporozyma unispora]
MLRTQTKFFTTSVATYAAAKPAAKGKAQGFSKASSGYVRPASKRITSATLYKNWTDTMHTAKLNKNAKEVNLPIFKPSKLDESLNKMSNFSPTQLKHLYHLGSFKKNQYRELFALPSSLIREDTIGKLISQINNSKGSKRIIVTGEPGVGKSTLLAQLHAYAIDSNYLVLNIPYPELFLNGRNDFFLDETTQLYVQPMYLKKLLSKILKGNDEKVLSSLKLQKDHKFSFTTLGGTKNVELKKGESTVLDLLKSNVNANIRGLQFKTLIEELFAQKEVPILFTVDNFSRVLTRSFTDYRDTENRLILTLKFQITDIIMSIVSGKIKFANPKSSFVGAISGSDRTNKTLPVGLNKIEEDVYIKKYHYDPSYANLLKQGKVEEFELSKMSKEDVKRLLDFYTDCDIIPTKELQNKTLDQLTDEKFFISGNGNPRELLKSITLAYR